ncbi:hypothetical protein ACFLT3_02180 [Chloroflexota bacterium]
MLEHPKRYQWMQVEADEAGVLDDILVLRNDNSYIARQIKYAGHPEEESDAWTWDKLLIEPDHKQVKKTSLLYRWFCSWQELTAQGTVAEAALVSNRRAGDDLYEIIDSNGAINFNSILEGTKKEIIRQFGSEEATGAFFSEFRFRVDMPALDILEDSINRRFFNLGGTREGWLSLKDQLRLWVRERYEPPPDGSITIHVVRIAARWHYLRSLPEDFEVPEDYTLPSKTFHETFFQATVQRDRNCIVLAAPPALGKSTYLSYLVGELQKADIPVIRHHYFLKIGDRSIGRFDYNRVAESLMSELLSLYPHSLDSYGYKNPNIEELGEWLATAGAYFSQQGKSLVVIIDGLDHVWRERDSRDELVRLFEYLLPAPEGVVVLVGTQPVDEEQLPPSLIRECPRDEWIQLEPFDQDAVMAWLQRHEDEIDLPDEPTYRQNVLSQLTTAFYVKTKGHPLHLRFILQSLIDRGQGVSAEAISNLPGEPSDDIMAYYSALWNSLPEDGRQILHLLAGTNFPWPLSGVVEALDPGGANIARVNSAIRQVCHLLTVTVLGLQPFHSSLQVFVRSHESHSMYAGNMRAVAREWLKTAAPDYWRWAYSWLLDADDGQPNRLINEPSRIWIIESLIRGYPHDQISEILGRSAWAALEEDQLGRFVELALLKDNFQWQEHQALLSVQLALGLDDRLRDISIANVEFLALPDIVSLARYETRQGNYTSAEKCFKVLNRGLPNDVTNDQIVEWAQSLLTVVALLPNMELDRLINFIKRFRKSGASTEVIDALARSMRIEKDISGLRKLMSYSNLSSDECIVVRRHAFALAYEDSIDIGLSDIQTWNDPFSTLYQYLHFGSITSPDILWPPWSLLDRPKEIYSSRRPSASYFFKTAFYALLTRNIQGEMGLIDDWINQAPTAYVQDLLKRTNQFTSQLANAISNKADVPFPEPYRHFEYAQRPNRWGGDSETREAAEIAEGMQAALSEITFDLVFLQHEWTASITVSVEDLQAVFSSPFSECWDWVASYLKYGRPFLPETSVTWLINELEGSTDRRIDEFHSQAERYAKLASISVMHDRSNEEVERLLNKSFSNTIAYGTHKDMLIYSMLEIAEACHQTDMPGVEGWLLTLAPAIAHVCEYTDGDETDHFSVRIGKALAVISPNRLPDYYVWLIGQEEYFDARSVFHELIRIADLEDPVVRAIASTGLDKGSLQVLQERAEAGDSTAIDLLKEVTAIFGTPLENIEDMPTQDIGMFSSGSKDKQPYASDYPPPQIEDFLRASDAKGLYETSELIKVWLEFWDYNQQGLQAYEAVKGLADTGCEIRSGDIMANLAKRFYGTTDEMYRWLASANREQMGWSEFYTNKKYAQERWVEIRENFPDRWLQFIKETITQNQVNQWNSVTANNYVLRLVEYCIALGHTDHACQIAEKVLSIICELTSPAPLTSPSWLHGGKAEMGGNS